MNKNANVLVVDDEEVVRLSYRRVLDAECNVAVATSGTEALQAMEKHPYDVVLLDVRMPGMDGMAVLKTIKQKWPESEVVIITGYPSVENAKEAVRLGAYDYLAKPLAPAEVVHAASAAMAQKEWALHCD